MKSIVLLLALGLATTGTSATGCEVSRAWFNEAPKAEMIGCMTLDFLSGREGDQSNVLHLAIAAGADTDVLVAIRTAALGDWETRRKQKDEKERTALHVAAASATDPRVVTWLLADGADPDGLMPPYGKKTFLVGRIQADSGTTPLHLAALRPDAAVIVTALLAGGADPEREDARGDRPVHLAARMAETSDVLAAFLANDDDALDEAGRGGFTPLMIAVAADRPPGVLRYMLDADADPDPTNDDGLTAVELAAEFSSDAESVRALFEVTEDPCGDDGKATGALRRLGANPALGSEEDLRRLFHKACVEGG